ncbi:MAG: DUF4835 family protein [Bacteroidia bacterium]|nr:DUF4835 family protein [Bacteroidia bacterium]
MPISSLKIKSFFQAPLILLCLLCYNRSIKAQELNCQITINSDQIQGTTEKQIFDQLEKSIFEFMNNTRWTKDVFAPQERIDCSFFITIKQKISSDQYSGSIQVQCRRPVYKSSMYTQLFNCEDDNFYFTYQQFSQLDFNINTFQNNLTSVLAYYAYVVIAMDYDSFSPLGGTEYWQKAMLIVQNAQSAVEPGWKSNQSNRNRYWLVENTLQPLFKGLRDCIYDYSRKGLDVMHQNVDEGRAVVLASLELIKPVYNARPANYNIQLFFNAKADELVNIFKSAPPEDKNKALEILMLLDPANSNKYAKIQAN